MDRRVSGRLRVGGVLIALVASACAVSPFSQEALDFAVDIKVESLAVMDQATDDFASHVDAVSRLRERMDAALTHAGGRDNNMESTHAGGRDNNVESTQQWELMADPNGNLLGGFLSTWEQRGTVSPSFIEEKKIQVGRGFDLIAETEDAKRESNNA
jgi:hypothetical protein